MLDLLESDIDLGFDWSCGCWDTFWVVWVETEAMNCCALGWADCCCKMIGWDVDITLLTGFWIVVVFKVEPVVVGLGASVVDDMELASFWITGCDIFVVNCDACCCCSGCCRGLKVWYWSLVWTTVIHLVWYWSKCWIICCCGWNAFCIWAANEVGWIDCSFNEAWHGPFDAYDKDAVACHHELAVACSSLPTWVGLCWLLFLVELSIITLWT